jgi:hypothetical protein
VYVVREELLSVVSLVYVVASSLHLDFWRLVGLPLFNELLMLFCGLIHAFARLWRRLRLREEVLVVVVIEAERSFLVVVHICVYMNSPSRCNLLFLSYI